MIGSGTAPTRGGSVKSIFSIRTRLILASVAFVLISVAIALNYFAGGEIKYVHLLFALGLLAYVVWFSGRRDPN